MRIGSLFSGYGGLDQAAAQVFPGTSVAWHSDIKPAAVALLAHRFPDAPNVGDITTVDWSRVGPVDLLTFGWPCQPHSSAGLRLGEKDPRALLPEVVRCASVLRPRVLLGENVARVTSNGELRRALRAFAEIGYVGAWRCVTAAEVGAPHKRDRLALVAVRADAVADTCRELVWDEPGWRGGSGGSGAGVAGDDGPSRAAGLTLLPTPTQNMTTGPGRQGRAGGMNLQTAAVTLLPTPAQRDGRRGAGWGDLPGRPLSETIHRVTDGWGEYAAAIERWETTLGRVAPAPTVTSARNGKPQLSPRFVEWMMGLAEGWVTDVPGLARRGSERNAMLSLLGDGVVPQQMAHGFRLALDHLAASCAA